MLRSFIIVCCCVVSAFGLPNPQRLRSSSESPVIYIDFNYEGKPGEKSERSLDQVTYNDGVNRGRSSFKDSYGNPVTIEYDTLEQIDAKQPSKSPTDPNKFIIPGYASGILQPHELPSRVGNTEARSIDDDRIHFIDPLQNSFQNTDKSIQAPPISLSPPFGSANNEPINIPRPNIDLNETPQAPVDDPLDHQLTPPLDNSFGAPQSPIASQGKNSPSNGVFIPRPNLDAPETPIDNSNGPINQGLLPPSVNGGQQQQQQPSIPSFISPSQEGPVVFTEGNVNFAPKPSNGLLPPKDPSPNDVNFQQDFTPTTQATVNKFSFGGPSGILGNAVDKATQKVENTVNKFTGSFGGPPGILGGSPALNNRQPTPSQIPVTVVQPPASPSSAIIPPPPSKVDKFTGSFGGSPGILGGSQAPNSRQPTPSQIPVTVVQAPASTSPVLLPPAPSKVDKFTGSFGGPPGILVNEKFAPTQVAPAASTTSTLISNKFDGVLNAAPSVQTPTTIVQLPSLSPATVSRGSQKYTGSFGGSPGILTPYDTVKN